MNEGLTNIAKVALLAVLLWFGFEHNSRWCFFGAVLVFLSLVD